MSSKNKIAWTYTDDRGNTYRRSASKAITDQLGVSTNPKVGGSDGSGILPTMPRWLKPRRVILTYLGTVRSAVCYSKTSELYVGTETTLTLEINGADHAFTVAGWEGERMAHRATVQTT